MTAAPRALEYGTVTDVTEAVAGDELAADVAAGVLQLQLYDAVDFDEAGGTLTVGEEDAYEVVSYSSADLDFDTVQLSTGLAAAYPEGTPVRPSPPVVERRALVRLDLDGEAIDARVPHALFDRLDLGTRSGVYERVSLHLDGSEWVVEDVLAQEPVVDGGFINPDTLPPPQLPPPTDGTAPAFTPTPSAIGGVGVVHVRWVNVENADPLTYEVHLSTVDGFTPSAATLVAETSGTAVTLRTLPDGTPLAYNTVDSDGNLTRVTYFVRLIAKDDDGPGPVSTQSSAQLYEVGQEEISAGYAYLGTVSADQLTAGTMSAEVTISGLFQTAEQGRRAVMDAEGLHLYDSLGKALVDLPTDTAKAAQFKGTAELSGASVSEGLSLKKPTTAKPAATVQPGAYMELANGVQPPGSAPAVSLYVPDQLLTGFSSAGDDGQPWYNNALFVDAEHFWIATNDVGNVVRVQKFRRSDGVLLNSRHPAFTAEQSPSNMTERALVGLTRIGTTWYLAMMAATSSTSGPTRIIKYTDDTFATQITDAEGFMGTGEQCLGITTDGTYLYVACNRVGNRSVPEGTLRIRKMHANTLGTAEFYDDPSGRLFTNYQAGDAALINNGLAYGTFGQFPAARFLVHDRAAKAIRSYALETGQLIEQPNEGWNDYRVGAFDWDGQHFIQTADRAPKGGTAWVCTYSNLTWSGGEDPVWRASYAWLNVAANKRTPPSPVTSFTMKKRWWVRLTGEDVPLTGAPDDPDSARHYLGRSSDPLAAYKVGDGVTVEVPETFAFTGETPVTTTMFASGAASDLRSGAKRRDGTPLTRLLSDGNANVDGLIPPGSIQMYAGATAPTGWLVCNGQAVSRTLYPDLAAALYDSVTGSYRFGNGDGTTTFNLPDFTERLPKGPSASRPLGQAGGSMKINAANLPPHEHGMGHDHADAALGFRAPKTTTTNGADVRVTDIDNQTGGSGTGYSASINIPAFSGNTGTGTGLTNNDYLPPFLSVTFLIKT